MAYQAYSTITIEPTVDTNAYAANDVVGGIITVPLGRFNQGFVVNSMAVFGNTQTPALTFKLFDSLPTATYTDNAAYAPSAADLLNDIGTTLSVAAADYATENSLRIARVQDINRVITMRQQGSQNLYMVLVAGNAFTFTTTSSLQIRLTVIA